MMKYTVLVLGLLLGIIASASGQEPPCVYPREDQVDAHVRASVSQSASGLTYGYLVENRLGAPESLVRFAIQAFVADDKSLAQVAPLGWEARGRIADTAFYSWTTFSEPRGLAPGTSIAGFGFAQADLPTIARFLAWNYAEPPSFPEGKAPDSCEGDDVIQNSFKGKTVGPKPPPQTFVPIEFLNYLISLLHDSRQLGWIKVDGVHQSLLGKLITAKRKLEAGETQVAKDTLSAFLNEVRGASCLEFSCPGNRPETSEAYALLFFNGQFLWERLP